MMKHSKALVFASFASVLTVVGLAPAFAGPIYSVTDLGTLGGTRTISTGISSNGSYVTGSSSTGPSTHAFAYSGGGMTNEGTLSGTSAGNAVAPAAAPSP